MVVEEDVGLGIDLTVSVDGDPQFEHRFAGHVENGEDSISDPLMGGLV